MFIFRTSQEVKIIISKFDFWPLKMKWIRLSDFNSDLKISFQYYSTATLNENSVKLANLCKENNHDPFKTADVAVKPHRKSYWLIHDLDQVTLNLIRLVMTLVHVLEFYWFACDLDIRP